MDMKEYRHRILCEPIWSDKDQRLHQIAEHYYATCEEYDRTVCTGPIVRGSIQPANGSEMAAINRHALSVRKECDHLAESSGCTVLELKQAMKRYIE